MVVSLFSNFTKNIPANLFKIIFVNKATVYYKCTVYIIIYNTYNSMFQHYTRNFNNR